MCRFLPSRNRVAHPDIGDFFEASGDVPHRATLQGGGRHQLRPEGTKLERFQTSVIRHQQQRGAPAQRTVHDAHIGHDSLVAAVLRIEDERARRRLRIAIRWRYPLHDRLQQFSHAFAGLGRNVLNLLRGEPDHIHQLPRHLFPARDGEDRSC